MQGKVIFHIDESSKWELTLKNAANLMPLIDMEASQIEILANAEAVQDFRNKEANPYGEAMLRLSKQGVYFAACNNALKGMGIPPEQLMPFVHVVLAGVLELMQRQAQGYAYIKP